MTRFAGSSPAGVVLKCMVTAAAVVLAAYLVWGLRTLIVPIAVGGLLAYICRPLVVRFERAPDQELVEDDPLLLLVAGIVFVLLSPLLLLIALALVVFAALAVIFYPAVAAARSGSNTLVVPAGPVRVMRRERPSASESDG